MKTKPALQNGTPTAPGCLSPAIPPQPPETSWRFIRELQQPLHHRPIPWERRRPRAGEIDLRRGVRLDWQFPDPYGLLDTMHADFRRFLRLGGIPEQGAYRIATGLIRTVIPETYRVEVTRTECRVLAGDTEGIRRGLVFLEDELQRNGGPFLQPCVTRKTPVIRTRLSRCFFGPIKRPPKNRDELADDVDYYPAEYLNRLAHDGVNGLWLTVEWKDLVPSGLFPGAGRDAARRFAKLNRTIDKCARYGIKIFIFCIEPASIPPDSPALKRHPELAGHHVSGNAYFCVSSPAGLRYVEETTRKIFTAAPGLGGMAVISVGERPTHCYSAGTRDNRCPRCSRRQPREVLADSLAAMERGMHAVNPAAELISWPYSQYIGWGEKLTADAAGHVPPKVILQHNFESGGRARQLGRTRYLGDYWLAYIGPSRVFRDCARRAAASGTRMSAKLQVGCSHETATAPFVPVPGNLYAKYRAMHRLGVSGAMYGWYFGTYPSPMTRAAGELAFAPFPRSESEFLTHLARRDWGRHAARVAKAWQWFQQGYRQFPYAAMAGYYGPCHDGPVWPLYLIPRDLPLAPTWQIKHGVSGDRIGEMICYSHTTREFQQLLAGMARDWRRGMQLLAPLRQAFRRQPERLRDLGVAEALGIQFNSASHILDFYLLREDLPFQTPARQRQSLRRMRQIVQDEIRLDRRLLDLARADSRLGFHSEAEGYKYHPALIRWRMRQLEKLLRVEFPRVATQIAARRPLFEGYAFPRAATAADAERSSAATVGKTDAERSSAATVGKADAERSSAATRGKTDAECSSAATAGETVYHCRRFAMPPAMNGRPVGPAWDALPEQACQVVISPHAYWSKALSDTEHAPRKTRWKAGHDGRNLYVGIVCAEPDMARLRMTDDGNGHMPYPWWDNDCAGVMLEPRRLWPCQTLLANARGGRWQRWKSPDGEPWQAAAWRGKQEWSLILRIPLNFLRERDLARRPLRLDVIRAVPSAEMNQERMIRWRPFHPWLSRLALRTDNPGDLGWMVLDE